VGLGYDELYDLTPRAFNNKLQGFNSYQETLMRDRWEQTRAIVQGCVAPHSKKKLKAQDILPFPWDNEKKSKNKKIATKEEMKAVLDKYDKIKLKKV